MKLNLVPATAKKGAAMRTMVVITVLSILASAGATAAMIVLSGQRLDAAKQASERWVPAAQAAVATAKSTQQILDSSRGIATNLDLAKQMSEHNSKYTRFYAKVMPYVPNFFRLNSISVEPINETSARLTLGGVLFSAQQYADMSLALLRIPGAQGITRSGFSATNDFVPGLTQFDQEGRVIPRDRTSSLPVDPVDRMNAIIEQANEQTTGFANVSNFGSPTESARGPMQRWTQVQFSVLLAQPPGSTLPPGWDFNFQVPNPAQTLAAAAQFNGPAAQAAGGAAVPGGGIPNPAAGAAAAPTNQPSLTAGGI